MRRLLRRIPRFSLWTWLLSLVVAVSIIWFCNDHEPWVVQRTLPRAFSSLAGNVSPDRRRIIVRDSPSEVESTGRLSICDIDTGNVLNTFGISNDCRRQIIFSPDGSRLLTLGGWQQLTDSTNGISSTRTLGGPVEPPHLWDPATGTHIGDLDPLPFTGQACFSPDGRRIITMDSERATLYDGATGQRLAVLEKSENGLGVGHAAFFSPDSKLVVISMLGPTPARVHSTIDGRVTSTQAPAIGIWDSGDMPAAFSPDGRTLAFLSGVLVQQIDVSTGEKSAAPVRLNGGCWRLWYAPDGRRIYALSNTGSAGSGMVLAEIDSGSGRLLATAKTTFDLSPCILTSPDGRQLIFFYQDRSMEVFDSAKLTSLHRLIGRSPGNSLAPFSPDGSRVVSIASASPSTVEVLDTRTWRPTSTIHDPWSQFSDAIFIGDSAHLLTATGSGTIQLWHRRRPEAMWGFIALSAFWLVTSATVAWCVSFRRDLKLWKSQAALWSNRHAEDGALPYPTQPGNS